MFEGKLAIHQTHLLSAIIKVDEQPDMGCELIVVYGTHSDPDLYYVPLLTEGQYEEYEIN